MSLGKRLRLEREKRNWSQIYVAKKLGITNTVLSNYERDYRDPDTENLRKLAELYNVTVDYLLGLTDYPNATFRVADQDIELTPEELLVFKKMKKHPQFGVMFHDLAKDPEKKIKTLIKMWEVIKEDIED